MANHFTDWTEAQNTSEADKAALIDYIEGRPKDAKQRRKQFRKSQWPGRQGERGQQAETLKSAPATKARKFKAIMAAPPTLDTEEGWTCKVFLGEEEAAEFHAPKRGDAKRSMRAYIREKLGLSIRTAEQYEDQDNRETIVTFRDV